MLLDCSCYSTGKLMLPLCSDAVLVAGKTCTAWPWAMYFQPGSDSCVQVCQWSAVLYMTSWLQFTLWQQVIALLQYHIVIYRASLVLHLNTEHVTCQSVSAGWDSLGNWALVDLDWVTGWALESICIRWCRMYRLSLLPGLEIRPCNSWPVKCYCCCHVVGLKVISALRCLRIPASLRFLEFLNCITVITGKYWCRKQAR
jgi:hypothetical protein